MLAQLVHDPVRKETGKDRETARRGRPPHQVGVRVRHPLGPSVRLRIPGTEARNRLQHQVHLLRPLVVIFHVLRQLLPAQPPLVDHPLLDRRERIRHRRQPHPVAGQPIDVDPTLGHVQPPLDRPVHKQIEHDLRRILRVVFHVPVESPLHRIDADRQMVQIALPQEIQGRLLLTRHHVVEGVGERRHQAHPRHVLQTVLDPRQRRPVAPHLGAHPRHLDRHSVARVPLVQPLGAGVADAGAVGEQILDRLAHQLRIQVVVQTHGDIDRDLQRVHRLEDQEGDAAGHILTGNRIRTADL